MSPYVLHFSFQPHTLAHFVLQQTIEPGNLLMKQPSADRAQSRHQTLPIGLLQPLAQTSDIILSAGIILLPLRIQTLYLKWNKYNKGLTF